MTQSVFSLQDRAMVPTYTTTSSDTAVALSTDKIIHSSGRYAKAVFSTGETNAIRWAVGVNPNQSTPLSHVLAAGSNLRLSSFNLIKDLGSSPRLLVNTQGCR